MRLPGEDSGDYASPVHIELSRNSPSSPADVVAAVAEATRTGKHLPSALETLARAATDRAYASALGKAGAAAALANALQAHMKDGVAAAACVTAVVALMTDDGACARLLEAGMAERMAEAMRHHSRDAALCRDGSQALGHLVRLNVRAPTGRPAADRLRSIGRALQALNADAHAASSCKQLQDALRGCGACQSVVAALGSYPADAHVQKHGCFTVAWLAWKNEANAKELLEAGACQSVVAALGTHAKRASVTEAACAAAEALGHTSAQARGALCEAGAAEAAVVACLTFRSEKGCAQRSCGAIASLGRRPFGGATRMLVMGAADAVVACLRRHRDAPDVQAAGAALGSLGGESTEQADVVLRAGAVQMLCKMLDAHCSHVEVAVRACEAAARLAAHGMQVQDQVLKGGVAQLVAGALAVHEGSAAVQLEGCRALARLTEPNPYSGLGNVAAATVDVSGRVAVPVFGSETEAKERETFLLPGAPEAALKAACMHLDDRPVVMAALEAVTNLAKCHDEHLVAFLGAGAEEALEAARNEFKGDYAGVLAKVALAKASLGTFVERENVRRATRPQRPDGVAMGDDVSCLASFCDFGRSSVWRSATMAVTLVQLAFFVACCSRNGGLQPTQGPGANPLLGPSADTLRGFGAKDYWLIRYEHQYWRMFTTLWLHGGLVHLGLNFAAQFRLGWSLEKHWGMRDWMVIYIGGGLGGSFLSCALLPQALTVGASSSIMALFGAFLADVVATWDFFPSSRMVNLRRALLGNVVGVGACFFAPHVDWASHAGGATVGFLVGWYRFVPREVLFDLMGKQGIAGTFRNRTGRALGSWCVLGTGFFFLLCGLQAFRWSDPQRPGVEVVVVVGE